MADKEKRKEWRIPVSMLPAEYRKFSVLMSHETECTVTTTDVSLNGFGFLSTLPPENFIEGSHLVLYPLGTGHPLYGIVIHSRDNGSGTRVGLQLQHIGAYATYREAIAEILALVPREKQGD